MAWFYNALIFLDRGDEAKMNHERMLATDPLSTRSYMHRIRQAENRGRIDEAHALADRLAERNPSVGYDMHAGLSWREGRLAEALSWALRASRHHHYVMEAFLLVREYDEARRIGSRFAWWIDIAEGRWDDAVQASRKLVQLYPDNSSALAYAAELLYRAGRFDEALPLYERAHDLSPEDQPIFVWSNHYTMQLALVRREAGDEEGAQAAVEIVNRVHAEGDAAGAEGLVEAMVAAFEHDPDRAIAALESAIRDGHRWWMILDDPIFEDLGKDPRFIALRQDLDAILAEEREKVLQLICFNNPVPDEWRPMPETCDGVVDRSSL